MTLERLRNYLLDKQEIADLETKTRTVQSNYVMDVVRGSMPDFPYTARTVSVRGLSDDDLNAVSEDAARIAQLKLGCKEVEIVYIPIWTIKDLKPGWILKPARSGLHSNMDD